MTSQMLHRGITSGCGGSRQLTDFHQHDAGDHMGRVNRRAMLLKLTPSLPDIKRFPCICGSRLAKPDRPIPTGHVRQSPSGVRRLITFARLPSTPRIVACAVLSPASPQGDAPLNLADLLSCSLSKIAHSAGTPASRCASGSTAWRFHKGESAMVDGSPPAHGCFRRPV
jgi:hypothetical protein